MTLAAVSIVAAAWWLRVPSIRYLVAGATATAVSIVLAVTLAPPVRRWSWMATLAVALFYGVAATGQREMWRIEHDWPAYRQAVLATGAAMLRSRLDETAHSLRDVVTRALDAPRDPADAFDSLERTVGAGSGRGTVLYRDGRPVAWAGRTYVDPDTLSAELGAVRSSFYLALYATSVRDGARAVAVAVVHAEPPADRLATPLAAGVSRVTGSREFRFAAADSAPAGDLTFAYAPGGRVLFQVGVVPPEREAAHLRALGRARTAGTLLLVAATFFFVLASWRRERSLSGRLVPLAVALVCLALAPLNTFSGETSWFDPAVYYATLGGAYTASVGALAGAGGVALLALLLVLRARARLRSRLAALAVVIAVMAGGPFLIRALSRGVTPPPGGVEIGLWLAWELALFLVAASLLLGAAAAGGVALGASRGLPPAVAPTLAALAAMIGPLVLRAPGRWPFWYPLLWVAAIGTMALTRRHRALVLTAASVAALGATTLTWSAGLRARAALAERDVAGLTRAEPYIATLLERLADSLVIGGPPRTEPELVRRYVRSDLAGTGYPAQLRSWSPGGIPEATVALAPFGVPERDMAAVVSDARESGVRQLREVAGLPGTFVVLAVPYGGGVVTSVVVAPRTRLIPDDPFASLLGVAPTERGAPPYVLSLIEVDGSGTPEPGETRWYRDGSELHGDRVFRSATAPVRAHVEIDMRTLDTLVPYGTLVVLLDLLAIFVLWLLSVFPDGGLGRWLGVRRRRWAASYRVRLTVALFGFFVIPAAAFALWSYRQLQSEDRESRNLLVRELLRSAAASTEADRLHELGDRFETPLLLYANGALQRTSRPLYDALAPVGRFLPPEVYLDLQPLREVYAATVEQVGQRPVLFGYRAVVAGGGHAVLAAPARGGEETLDRRRRDLAVLVLFATVLGALGALALSGIAARSLATPIGRLRRAALAIAAGEHEPPLTGEPPLEFRPVFSAFRRMARDLGESRAALEEAQRRTSTVLRNVASGVIAMDGEGTVTLANPRAEALLKRPLPPGTGLRDPSEAVLVARLRDFLLESDDEQHFEVVLDGRQLQARLTRLAAGGAVLTLDDVTDLARAQRVLAWGEMARQVAHEIKNPLTPIRLGVQHLRRAYSDARTDFDQILDQNVRRILAEIDRLDEIARGFSRYGTAPAERLPGERTDVAAVIRDVLELERIGRDTVQWCLHGGDTPVFAHTRDDELREVLLNVLENARLANARRVDVRLLPDTGRLIIEVADDGHGIPAHTLPRIFEPHFSTRTSGSGLGLALSRQLVEGWGGGMAIASIEGEGTTVRIELRSDAQ